MATVHDLEAAGYTVGEAFRPQEGGTVHHVAGHGVETYVHDGDEETIDALIESAANPAEPHVAELTEEPPGWERK